MNKYYLTTATALCLTATMSVGQSFIAAGQVPAAETSNGSSFIASDVTKELVPVAVSRTGELHLACPFDLLEQAYREATTGFQTAGQYVTTLEVLSLCADHDRLFKQALDTEKQLVESYNALIGVSGQGTGGANARTTMESSTEAAAAIAAAVQGSSFTSFLAQVAQCLPMHTVGLDMDKALDVSVPLAADGKIAGDLTLLSGQESEADAPRPEFDAVSQAILACGTGGYDTDGLDLSQPLEVNFTLGELYDLKSASQMAAGVDANGCPVPRPADAYVMTSYVAASGQQPLVDLALEASLDQASGWFTETFFVKVGEELPGGVKVVEINVTDYDDPNEIKHVILRDCAGELREDMTTLTPRASHEASRSIVTYRNYRTGETTPAPAPTVIPPRHE